MISRAPQLLDLWKRQHVFGSSGESFNSAMNRDPGTFVLRNHFSSFHSFTTGVLEPTSTASRTRSWREPLFLIPLGQAGTGEERGQGPQSCCTVSWRNQFSLFPLSSDRRRRSQKARPRGRRRTVFPRNRFSSFLHSRSAGPRSRTIRPSRAAHTFLRRNHFSSFLKFTETIGHWLYPQLSARSSLHGDSGILAVQKTDGSVLRFPPPTS